MDAPGAVERVEAALRAAEEHADLGALWVVAAERALARAAELDHLPAEVRGALHGEVVVWKDCFDVEGLPTTGGAPWRRDAGPAESSATVVGRFETAGAVCLGKAAMTQLAWGMMGQTPGRPTCRNPHAPDRVPGGSSSGSAVAVATGIADHAPGTDAGGSVRHPAAMCGVVGFKPSFGAVPLDGCMPYTPSFDTGGPIARSVADAARQHAVLAAVAPADVERGLDGLRVGLATGYFLDDVEPAWRAPVEDLARSLGAVPVDVGWTRDCNKDMSDVYSAEPFAYVLANDPELAADGYDATVLEDVASARAVTAISFLHSQDRLASHRERCARAVLDAGVDIVLSPSAPIAAVPIDGPDRTTRMNALTKPFNGLRWPAITLPCGTDADGLPLSLQLAALPGRDDDVLRAAWAVERLLR